MKENSTALTLTLLLGIFIQVLFTFADNVDTPNKTVVAFSKAYFKLDPAMSAYLCETLADDEANVVDRYIQGKIKEAQIRGFAPSYLKSYLFEIKTHTLARTDDSARIRIQCHRKKSINPVYAIVGKIFFLGGTDTVDEVIELVKEDGKWKICGSPFSLS